MSDATYVCRNSTTYYCKPVEKFIIDLDSDESAEEDDSDFEDDGQSEIDPEVIREPTPGPPSTSRNLSIASNAPPLPTATPASHQPGLARLAQDFRVALKGKRPVHEVAAAEDRILQHLHNIPATVAAVKELLPEFERCFCLTDKLSTNIALYVSKGQISDSDKEAMLEHILLRGHFHQNESYKWTDNLFNMTVEKIARYKQRKDVVEIQARAEAMRKESKKPDVGTEQFVFKSHQYLLRGPTKNKQRKDCSRVICTNLYVDNQNKVKSAPSTPPPPQPPSPADAPIPHIPNTKPTVRIPKPRPDQPMPLTPNRKPKLHFRFPPPRYEVGAKQNQQKAEAVWARTCGTAVYLFYPRRGEGAKVKFPAMEGGMGPRVHEWRVAERIVKTTTCAAVL